MKRLLLPFLLVAGLSAEIVRDIEFEGLIHISKITAEDVVGIKRDSTLDVRKVDSAIKELFDYGYFEDIEVYFEEGTLRFILTERPIISRVDMSGYKERDKENILKHLRLTKGTVYDTQKLDNARREILALLEFEGYFDSVVEFETKRDGSSIEVDILVRRGEKIHIEDLTFVGNEQFSDRRLEKQLQNKEREFLGWMWGRNDGVVKVAELEADKHRIKDYYMRFGYLDVEVEDGVLETEFGGYKAKQLYKVIEGDAYKVANIEIIQTQHIIDEEELEVSLRVGREFNIDRFRRDNDTLRNVFADRGYAYVRVMPEVIPNSEDKTVDIRYVIEPNQKVYINDVVITGNTRTIDRVVRREVFLAPGDLYSLTDMRDSRNALNRTGYFQSVEIIEKRVDADKIDLEVKVVEQPTGSIVLGAGYGSYDGFIYNMAVSDRNILGTGLDVGVDVEKSNKRNTYNFRVNNPRVWDSDYSAGINVFNREYAAYDYDERSKGGSVFVGKRFSRHWSGNLTLLYVDYNIKYEDDTRDTDSYDKGSIIPTLSFNNTDSFYFPREGVRLRTSLEYAGAVGDSKFIKSNTTFSTYYGMEELINYDLILRYKARLGYLSDRGYLNINEKFYMGGVDTVRGYGWSSLSPRDANNYRTGGMKMFANSVEASIPLIDSANMRLAFFYDYGMIGQDSFDEIKRSSTGAVIEWLSPFAAIQFIFSKPLDNKPGDNKSTFEFSLGSTF